MCVVSWMTIFHVGDERIIKLIQMVHSEQNIRPDAHSGNVAQNDLDLRHPLPAVLGLQHVPPHLVSVIHSHLFLEAL